VTVAGSPTLTPELSAVSVPHFCSRGHHDVRAREVNPSLHDMDDERRDTWEACQCGTDWSQEVADGTGRGAEWTYSVFVIG
jgi:hypothetical protein